MYEMHAQYATLFCELSIILIKTIANTHVHSRILTKLNKGKFINSLRHHIL